MQFLTLIILKFVDIRIATSTHCRRTIPYILTLYLKLDVEVVSNTPQVDENMFVHNNFAIFVSLASLRQGSVVGAIILCGVFPCEVGLYKPNMAVQNVADITMNHLLFCIQ